jgi:hypothetical protein
MSQIISKHATALGDFLTKIKENRSIEISKAKFSYYILDKVDLTGGENRPISDNEIKQILAEYRYFEEHFTTLGLWMTIE